MRSVTVPMGEYALAVNVDDKLYQGPFDGFDIDADKLAELAATMDAPAAIERRHSINDSISPALVVNFAPGRFSYRGLSTLGFYDPFRRAMRGMPNADITILPESALGRQAFIGSWPLSPHESVDAERANNLVTETIESVTRHEVQHFADSRWDFIYDQSQAYPKRQAGYAQLMKKQRAEAKTDPQLIQMTEEYKELVGPWYRAAGRLAIDKFQLIAEDTESRAEKMLFGFTFEALRHRAPKAIDLRRIINTYRKYYLLPSEVEARASEGLHRHIGKFATIVLSQESITALQPQASSRIIASYLALLGDIQA